MAIATKNNQPNSELLQKFQILLFTEKKAITKINPLCHFGKTNYNANDVHEVDRQKVYMYLYDSKLINYKSFLYLYNEVFYNINNFCNVVYEYLNFVRGTDQNVIYALMGVYICPLVATIVRMITLFKPAKQ